MQDPLFRLLILLAIGLATAGLVWLGRRFVARQRERVLAADAEPELAGLSLKADESASGEVAARRVHILAFSSEDCRQCHTLQAPALRRLQETYGENLIVSEIDAPHEPELTRRYHVLTVPTTVLLDAGGKAHAINYGFTNVQSLTRQIEEILVLDTVSDESATEAKN